MLALQALVIFVCVFGAALAVSRFIVWLQSKKLRVDDMRQMTGTQYLLTLLVLSLLAGAWVFAICLWQSSLSLTQALQTAVATMTHTNWQPWSPEKTFSPLTLAIGILPANILIGAVCISAWRALVMAFARQPLGNAWAGLWRGLLILMPLHILLTLILIWEGVPQVNMALFTAGNLVSGAGAGWFGANFASKVANPTLVSDLACLTALISIPLGFCYATGKLISRSKLLERLSLCVVLLMAIFTAVSLVSTPLPSTWKHWAMSEALWVNATAGSANGTLNAPIEHFSPAGRLPPFLTLLSGLPLPPAIGIGVGILLMHLLIATYIASLMVGRSPTFLGFKVRLGEVFSVATGVLGPQLVVLAGTAAVLMSPIALEFLKAHGTQGASALLWMLGSAGQNNGSAYALSLTQPVFVHTGIVLMLLGRVLTLGAVVIFASHISQQRTEPPVTPSVNEQGPLILSFWICVMLVGAALSMLPLIMLGPLLDVL